MVIIEIIKWQARKRMRQKKKQTGNKIHTKTKADEKSDCIAQKNIKFKKESKNHIVKVQYNINQLFLKIKLTFPTFNVAKSRIQMIFNKIIR